jgi:phosphohistidine phosphatase
MKIWLIRHAKSSWSEAGLKDFDRPLNARGERDGPRMADWLAAQSDPATWLWTSTAARARATARFVSKAFALSDDAVIETDELYEASPEAILDVLRRTPAGVPSVAVVAHNPGLTWLANTLGRKPVTDNLPTFGVVRFDCTVPWHELQAGCATFDFITAPKRIDDD